MEPVSLGGIVTETVAMVSDMFRSSGIRVETRMDRDSLLVKGNLGKLQQVVMNLLCNARHALEQKEGERRIGIAVEQPPDRVLLKVSDNGTGISPAAKSRLFEPFFTTKPPGKGTGLGLSIARNTVTKYNGQMSVESQEGLGSVFTVSFPRAAGGKP